MYRRSFIATLICLALLTFAGCSGQESSGGLPQILRIGVLPDQKPDILLARYTPLLKYLSSQLGTQYELVIPDSYEKLLADFSNNRVDLAYFGGVTYLHARERSGARPLVMTDTDLRFRSYFLVKANDKRDEISDFKDQTFSFGSRLSTSGHLMPRFFLGKKGIEPESFFSSVSFSGRHDLTAFHVRDGLVDLGVANAAIIDSMFTDDRLSENDVRIISITPPYADYVWALNPRLNDEAFNKIRDAFLSLDSVNSEHKRILRAISAGGFLPASDKDFAELSSVFMSLDLAY